MNYASLPHKRKIISRGMMVARFTHDVERQTITLALGAYRQRTEYYKVA